MELHHYIDQLRLQGDGPLKRHRTGGIRSLHPGAPSTPEANELENASAAVAVGAVIAFEDEISGQERTDVIESVQLAQRAATGSFNRFTQTEGWYGKFIEVLERVGWLPQAFGFIKHDQASGELEMDAAALDIVEAIATGGTLTVLRQAIATLKGSADADRRLVLFKRYASKDNSGNFQIGEVRKTDGTLTMTMGAFHYQASDRRVGILLGKWGANEVGFWSSAQTMKLNMDQYDKVRALVRQKLGDPTDYVASLGALA